MKKSSVEVSIRVRPLRSELQESKIAWDVQSSRITERGNPDNVFTFDKIYGMDSSTLDIYTKSVRDSIVKNVAEGYNGTVFAYGQTGSGKSFTMLGLGENHEGVVNMAIKDLFTALQREQTKATVAGNKLEINVFVAMLEIYNEQLRDLLIVPGEVSLPLAIRENEHGVYVHNALRRLVKSAEETLMIIHSEAEARRTSAATAMNERSSRSHCLIRILIERTMSFYATDEEEEDSLSDGEIPTTVQPSSSAKTSNSTQRPMLQKKIVSSLNLVDLAGSERVAKTGAVGIRMVEGGHINKSLTSLTLVINRLTEGGKGGFTHVPYRDSKLTHLLKTALGGNSFTSVFCCMTAADLHVDESRSTLYFASRAKTIKNEVQLNEVADSRTKIRELELEIKRLRKEQVATQIYLWSKSVKIKILNEQLHGGVSTSLGSQMGGTADPQMQNLISELTAENDELRAALNHANSSGGGAALRSANSFDPSAFADDDEKRELRIAKAELEQELKEIVGDNAALKANFAELEHICTDLEKENDDQRVEVAELSRKSKALETQLAQHDQEKRSLATQLSQVMDQIKREEKVKLEKAHGDELMMSYTRAQIELQSLQFEHNTLLDMYSSVEIEKASQVELLNEQLRTAEKETVELRETIQKHASALQKFISLAFGTESSPSRGGSAVFDENSTTVAVVRDHHVEAALKTLSAFVSSRASRPPGVLDNQNPTDSVTKRLLPTDASPATFGSSQPHSDVNKRLAEDSSFGHPSQGGGGDHASLEAAEKKIRELEQLLIMKDAQRDIIVDTKLKRIQDLVMRLHTTNGKLVMELRSVVEQNKELHEVIRSEPKLGHKLSGRAELQPVDVTQLLQRAQFALVPQRPYGHN